MKRFGGKFLLLILAFCLVPNVWADQITEKHLFSEVRGADDSDFPNYGNMLDQNFNPGIFAVAATGDPTDTVNVNPPNENLPYYPGWELYILPKPKQNLGNWDDATYEFTSTGGSPVYCTIYENALFPMSIPTNVHLNGNILSWDPVLNADDYNVIIFSLDNSGLPNLNAGPFVRVGVAISSTHIALPTNLPSVSYAIAIDSIQRNTSTDCAGSMLNRSRYFLKYSLPLPAEAVPTLNQWGFIIFGILLAGSAVLFIRKRKSEI